jgi:hypothetical protein
MRRTAIAWLVLTAFLALGATASSAAAKARQIVIYSQTTKQEFNNHTDDRSRGDQNNPFGTTTSVARAGTLIGHGPFPGDRTVFTFKLFSDSGLKSSIGSATFSCQYAFAKRGICQVEYVLDGGSLLGLGYIDFNAKTFALAVTGGTGKYEDARGDVLVTPDPKQRGNRVAFTLV